MRGARAVFWLVAVEFVLTLSAAAITASVSARAPQNQRSGAAVARGPLSADGRRYLDAALCALRAVWTGVRGGDARRLRLPAYAGR